MNRGKGLAPISEKRLLKLAAAGITNPRSTFMPKAAATKRAAYTGPKKSVTELVDERSGGLCEWPACLQPQVHRHHRLNRKQGGRHGEPRERINGAAWLLGACVPHHAYVTSAYGVRLKRAKAMGWLLMEHQDATQEPVWTRHSDEPVYLTPDGAWVPFEEFCA